MRGAEAVLEICRREKRDARKLETEGESGVTSAGQGAGRAGERSLEREAHEQAGRQ